MNNKNKLFSAVLNEAEMSATQKAQIKDHIAQWGKEDAIKKFGKAKVNKALKEAWARPEWNYDKSTYKLNDEGKLERVDPPKEKPKGFKSRIKKGLGLKEWNVGPDAVFHDDLRPRCSVCKEKVNGRHDSKWFGDKLICKDCYLLKENDYKPKKTHTLSAKYPPTGKGWRDFYRQNSYSNEQSPTKLSKMMNRFQNTHGFSDTVRRQIWVIEQRRLLWREPGNYVWKLKHLSLQEWDHYMNLMPDEIEELTAELDEYKKEELFESVLNEVFLPMSPGREIPRMLGNPKMPNFSRDKKEKSAKKMRCKCGADFELNPITKSKSCGPCTRYGN